MSKPRLKQLLTRAAQKGGIRANKQTALELGLDQVSTLCQYLRRYADSGLVFRHGEMALGGRSGGYWYTITPRGQQVLKNVRDGISHHNEDKTNAGRMRRYFLANPDEEMSHADLATKIGLPRWQVNDALGLLRKQGLVESLHIVRLTPQAKARIKALVTDGLLEAA
jgi:DNA-binding PadR family transcriptional regulator